jgi:DNA modification methylase
MVTLHLGDCIEVLAAMEAVSVDAVVCDPPYGLEFMNRSWDSFKPSNARIRARADGRTNPAEGKSVTVTPEAYVAGQPFQAWCQQWASECLRVLKPGGYLLAFGGTRTYHRLACGIEDAGFEVRDSMHWIYGSGFPKSLDVSKAIDKAAGAERKVIGLSPDSYNRSASSWQADDGAPHGMVGRSEGKRMLTAPATGDAGRWEGWGTALKPAHEPVVVARKPFTGTVAANVLAYGTGALNVAGCRVAHASDADRTESEGKNRHADFGSPARDNHVFGADERARADQGNYDGSAGRWPANILLTHSPDCHQITFDSDEDDCVSGCPVSEMDRQSGTLKSGLYTPDHKRNVPRLGHGGVYGADAGMQRETSTYGDSGGASRFFPVFRYEAKAPASERPRLADGTAHPTVKPVDLMAWLVRLVTPPGGVVLDPFAGSGTTAEACIVEGFSSALIEQDPAHAELIKTRLRKPIQPLLFGGEAS